MSIVPRAGYASTIQRNGSQIAELKCGNGHWNSPIVVDGKIALPEGKPNQRVPGVLDIWTLPTGQ